MAELKHTKLRECPFCGGEAKFTYSVDGSCMHIHCEDTNCIGSTIMNDYETEAEAIEAWNNRVTEADIRASAIDEFAERAIKIVYEANNRRRNPQPRDMVADIHYKLRDLAEQLKGE